MLYLSPGTGRMVITLSMGAEHHGDVPEFEGEVTEVIIVHRIEQIVTRLNMMSERDLVLWKTSVP